MERQLSDHDRKHLHIKLCSRVRPTYQRIKIHHRPISSGQRKCSNYYLQICCALFFSQLKSFSILKTRLQLPQHRCPALLPQPQGFSDGPENGLSSTRPSSQPGCRVSAPGDRFWRRRTPHSTCEMEVGAMEARGSFFFDRPESLCTRVLDPPGSPHAEMWAQGTPCGRGRPPPRPLRLPQHRCPALLPQPQGFSDGPENWLLSTRPSSQPGCRVSAPGDRFWRRRTPHST